MSATVTVTTHPRIRDVVIALPSFMNENPVTAGGPGAPPAGRAPSGESGTQRWGDTPSAPIFPSGGYRGAGGEDHSLEMRFARRFRPSTRGDKSTRSAATAICTAA